MNNIINNAFRHTNGAALYIHIKVGKNKGYFTNDPLDGDNKYTASDICKMIEFLVDNIYVRFGGQLFQQTVGIPIRTNCAPLLADLFLYSSLRRAKESFLESSISHIVTLVTLISFNNNRFKEFISDIYPKITHNF